MIDLLRLEAPEAERIAYAEGFTMAAELFARIAELEAERDALAEELEKAWERLPVRFFIVDYDLDEGPDIVEVDERDFLSADGSIKYERHTVFQNGVDQICLTKGFE
jgi:hypothetical protein